MAEFRRRKEKEIKRRRRNKRMTKIVLVIVVIWALIAVAAAAFHVTNGFGIFEGKKPSLSSAEETKDAIEQNEQQTLAEQNLKQTIESESKKEVAESEETSLEEKTEDATKASEAEKTVKRKYGLDVGKAYNKPAKNKNHVPVCPVEKELAIMDALKHFRMLNADVEYRKENVE